MGNRYYPINGKELASVTTVTGTIDKSDALIPWAVNCAVNYVKGRTWKPSYLPGGGPETLVITNQELEDARTKWREVRDEAGHIGTMVHDALEEYSEGHNQLLITLNAETYSEDPIIARCAQMATALINAAIKKLQDIGPYKVLGLEVKVANEDEWYAGRFDLLIQIIETGETWLIDFKTGASFYPEWGMQLAAYAEAWENAEIDLMNEPRPPYEWPRIDSIKVLRLDKKTLKAHWKEYGGEKDTLTRADYMTAFLGLRDAFYILKAKKAVKLAWLEYNTPRCISEHKPKGRMG